MSNFLRPFFSSNLKASKHIRIAYIILLGDRIAGYCFLASLFRMNFVHDLFKCYSKLWASMCSDGIKKFWIVLLVWHNFDNSYRYSKTATSNCIIMFLHFCCNWESKCTNKIYKITKYLPGHAVNCRWSNTLDSRHSGNDTEIVRSVHHCLTTTFCKEITMFDIIKSCPLSFGQYMSSVN